MPKRTAKKVATATTKKTAAKANTSTTKPAASRIVAPKKKAAPTAAKKATNNMTSKASTTKKTAAKKATAKKTAAKKVASSAGKKVTAKKVTAKPVTKKATAKKVAARDQSSASSPGGKSASATASKVAAKKTAAKKVAAKATAKKAASKRAAAKKEKITIPKARLDAASATVPTPLPDSNSTVVPYERDKSGHYMDAKQLEHFQQKLAEWKQQLMEEVDRTVGHMKDDATNFPDPNDRATQEEEFSLELRTRDRERRLIKKINEAQKRIDDDEYGYCETCGIEIGVNRLEARPTAELCIDCKTLEEIRERQTA